LAADDFGNTDEVMASDALKIRFTYAGAFVFIMSVLVASQSYHVLYGENTVSNYTESGDSATWFDAFSTDECKVGHSAQEADPSTAYVEPCEDGFLNSVWLDTYEFTVATTFLVSAIFLLVVALFEGTDSLAVRVRQNWDAIVLASCWILYGFLAPWWFSNNPELLDYGEGGLNGWNYLDGIVAFFLMVYAASRTSSNAEEMEA
jgi:hypothetical protein